MNTTFRASTAVGSFLVVLNVLLVMTASGLAQQEEGYRTWTDALGKYRIEASFQRFENGKVYLLRKQGDVISLTSGQLSKADREYVRSLLAKPRQPARAANTSSEWLSWRGPTQNGIALAGQTPPTTWSVSENVLWKTAVPGRGHSSPTIVGDLVVLSTADDQTQTQAVVAYDRETGKQAWATQVNRGGFPEKIHSKNTHASPTVVSNGSTLFVSFSNRAGIQVAALDLKGEQLWQQVAGSYDPKKYEFGYAASPVLHMSLLIVAADYEQGWLAALDQASGKEAWRVRRPPGISFSSPLVAEIAGRSQLILPGVNQLASYDPTTGKQLWTSNVLTSATCGTVVYDANNVYASGGYPKAETAAVAADGSGRVLWTNREKCYEQSMLLHEGYLYAVNDRMIAFCWRASDGEEMWSTRLGKGGAISASPVLAGGNLYCCTEKGEVFVFKATPTGYEQVAMNQTGDDIFASPAIVDNRIYLRVADRFNGARQEWLYCIGEK